MRNEKSSMGNIKILNLIIFWWFGEGGGGNVGVLSIFQNIFMVSYQICMKVKIFETCVSFWEDFKLFPKYGALQNFLLTFRNFNLSIYMKITLIPPNLHPAPPYEPIKSFQTNHQHNIIIITLIVNRFHKCYHLKPSPQLQIFANETSNFSVCI